MKHCPQCEIELQQDGDLTQCPQCGVDLLAPKTILIEDVASKFDSVDTDYTTVSNIIVVEEFSIEADLMQVDSTQESDDLETDLLLNESAVSKQLSIDSATQESQLSSKPDLEPTISVSYTHLTLPTTPYV